MYTEAEITVFDKAFQPYLRRAAGLMARDTIRARSTQLNVALALWSMDRRR